MGFVEQAESWRAKAHLSGVRLPVLVGVTALAALVLIGAGSALVHAAASDGFSVSRDDGVLAQGGEAQGNEGEAEAAPARIAVHVGGAVAEPGVRELDEGARVQDAVDAAGGFAEGAARDALNLARVLVDGEQIVVPTLDEVAAAASGGAGESGTATLQGATTAGGKVNLNRATAAELDALPGVGPSTAEKIVADREANGPFGTVEDLKRVSGIGDKKFADLADLVCVG
ncbi:ComEA family DNA-binding protein [Eggerthella sinensis]|uniref:ComEA family DNA-binding protein n=1 Tax=Eggerthella sinensis TaxID=242230 RepID=UPI00266B56EB|nr:ComEA family DNA-binding protein [Eggerthella sinensis]